MSRSRTLQRVRAVVRRITRWGCLISIPLLAVLELGVLVWLVRRGHPWALAGAFIVALGGMLWATTNAELHEAARCGRDSFAFAQVWGLALWIGGILIAYWLLYAISQSFYNLEVTMVMRGYSVDPPRPVAPVSLPWLGATVTYVLAYAILKAHLLACRLEGSDD